MSYQKREYILKNLDTRQEIVLDGTGSNNEPKNWENSDVTIKRDVKRLTTTKTASKELEFTGSGARFLIEAYALKDIEARVIMQEKRFNPRTDEPYIYIEGSFDFSDYSIENNVVKVPFNSGEFQALIKSKLNDKFELNRTEDINGNEINPLKINEFAVISRPLDLKSLLKNDEYDTESSVFRMSYSADYRYGFYPIPTTISYESDDNVASVFNDQFKVMGFNINIFDGVINQNNPFNNIRSHTFYYNSEIEKIINVSIKLKITVDVRKREDLIDNHLSLRLAKISGDDDPTINFPDIPLIEVSSGSNFPEYDNFKTILDMNTIWSSEPYTFDVNHNESIELLKGESLALYVFGGGNFDEFIGDAFLNLDFMNIESEIRIEELSTRDDLPRRCNFAFNKDVGESLINVLTGDSTRYKSDFFSSSDFKLTGLSTGKWIRGFSETSLTTSLKEFIDNSFSLFGMGYNIEIIDGKETFVHEPLKYFFRPQVVTRITEQVGNVKRTPAKEFIFSTIKSGYKKPSGDNLYEEVNGLNEFNTSNEYVTPITKISSEYDIESPYRADSEGKELTVRKSIKTHPSEDYRTDKTIFNLDLKDSGTDIYEERTWQDDYEVEPQNVFNPSTVTGLRLTPFRNMERHFSFINNAFVKFKEKYIRYSSTRGNSELITKKNNQIEYKENGNYQIKSLENPIFVSEWIEFSYPLGFDLINSINSFTYVDGKKIPNTYFKIEFLNEFNEKEYGYLFELKPNKEGKWKLLKAL